MLLGDDLAFEAEVTDELRLLEDDAAAAGAGVGVVGFLRLGEALGDGEAVVERLRSRSVSA